MQQSFIQKLIKRYIQGKSSANENALLDRWLDAIEKENPSKPLAMDEEEQIRARMLRNLQQKLHTHTQPRGIVYWRVAAALVPIIIISWLLIGYLQSTATLAYETGIGEFKEVLLPDSSRVWLKPNSKLTTPERFASTRTIQLEGEAFFDVRKDPSRPFVITTHALSVHVLGTSFDVRAYPAFKDIVVSVHTGRVSVVDNDDQELDVLIPSQRLRYHIEGKRVSRELFNTGSPFSRNLVFEDQSVSEILRMLEFYFPITFSGVAPEFIQLSGSFDPDMNADQIVDVLNTVMEQHNLSISKVADRRYEVK